MPSEASEQVEHEVATTERVLFVHAHPDDESISTGGTIATLVARGAHVTVLTCTRGELGEVIPQELQYLAADENALARHRETELAVAMLALGVDDHRYLGAENARWPGQEVRQYRDSGMRWGDTGAEAAELTGGDALTSASLGEVAADIAAVIADVEPHVVISYDESGGYGHPDHVRAHEAARRAAEVMGVAFYVVHTGDLDTAGQAAIVTVDVTASLEQKRRALSAHASQLTLDDDHFTLSNGAASQIGSTEVFRRIRPEPRESMTYRSLALGSKIIAIVFAFILGALAGLLLTAVHQSSVVIGEIVVPTGLIIAIAGSTALLIGLRLTFDTRVLPAVGAFALLGATALLAGPSRGGSVVIPANAAGYIWTFGPALVTLIVLAWPKVNRRTAGTIGGVPRVKGSSIP